MPNVITSLIGGATEPLSTLVSTALSIIDRVAPSAEEKAKAEVELLDAKNAVTLQLAQIDAQNYAAQSNVIMTEAKSESWLTRNWRPIVALLFALSCVVGFLEVLFGTIRMEQKDLVMAIAMEFLGITKICLGGYYFGRTVEKSGPDIVAAWRGKSAAPPADGGAK